MIAPAATQACVYSDSHLLFYKCWLGKFTDVSFHVATRAQYRPMCQIQNSPVRDQWHDVHAARLHQTALAVHRRCALSSQTRLVVRHQLQHHSRHCFLLTVLVRHFSSDSMDDGQQASRCIDSAMLLALLALNYNLKLSILCSPCT